MSDNTDQSKSKSRCSYVSDEQVVDYVLNSLPPDEEQELDAHLDICEECAARIVDVLRSSQAWCGEAGEERLTEFSGRIFHTANEAYLALTEKRECQDRPIEILVKPKEEIEVKRMPTSTHGVQKVHGGMFALGQLEDEIKEKECLGNWVSGEFQPEGGDSIYFDAGSNAFAAFKGFRDRVAKRPADYITAVTHNVTILRDWSIYERTNELQGKGTQVRVVGTLFDPVHQALFGADITKTLTSGDFRPSLVFVGTSGIVFEGDKIWFAYHAGEQERAVKHSLFRARCENRVILTTAKKIGRAHGDVFDLLSMEDLDKAPLYLVTMEPKAGSDRKPYDDMMAVVNTSIFRNAIVSRNIAFRWVEVRENGSSFDVINNNTGRVQQEVNHD